jgi:peptide/nickel transport system permease protein
MFGAGFHNVVIAIALAYVDDFARIVRGVFLSLREKEFVEAAKAAGAGDARIIIRHLLPNAVGPIIVAMTLIIAAAILIEAALSFLGFGIQPPTPALGKLIADGQTQGFEAWWLVTFPGLVIVLMAACVAVSAIGSGITLRRFLRERQILARKLLRRAHHTLRELGEEAISEPELTGSGG